MELLMTEIRFVQEVIGGYDNKGDTRMPLSFVSSFHFPSFFLVILVIVSQCGIGRHTHGLPLKER